MSAPSSHPASTSRRLAFVAPIVLIVTCAVASAQDARWLWAGCAQTWHATSHSRDRGPQLIEKADLFPTYASLPGEGRAEVPGVYHTRRLMLDPDSRQAVRIELALAEPRLVHSYSTSGDHPPRMALTFDDGPGPTYTLQISEIFAKNSARCTFFTLGGLVGGHKQILQRVEAQGHEIGIHSWWHASYTGLSSAAIQADIARCRSALDGVVEGPIRWVRPPYGNTNARVKQAINDAGYHVAMWSVDPRDWQSPGSKVVVGRILNAARDGAVVVLHDGGGNRAGTVAAMRTVVPELKRRGFELVTLSELTGLSGPPIVERGMSLAIGDETYEVIADSEDVRVTVDGTEVELPQPPVMINDQFLVPARAVLDALGSSVRWHPDTLSVSFQGTHGEFVVKLNSLDVTLGGDKVLVNIPSVYYHGTALLPVWLMANACGATVQWNARDRVIEFASSSHTPGTRSDRESLMTMREHDGRRICWWTRSPLLNLLPVGDDLSIGT